MNPRLWFVGTDGALRWPWRIVLFLAATVLCAVVAQFTVVPTLSAVFALLGIQAAAGAWLWLAAFLGGHVIMLRLVDRRPWSEVWLDRVAIGAPIVARGFVLGATAIGVPVVLLMSIGWLDPVDAPSGSWLTSASRIAVFLVPAAFTEELATRGYIFAVLRERWGWPLAIAATSIAFGLLHLQNEGANVQSVALVVLAGVFLAVVLWRTRSLYAATAAHFAWNWMLAAVFHAAVSGIAMEAPSYRLVDDGPDWATGGDWGPEGGAAGGLGMLGALAYLYARRTKRSTLDS